MPNWAKTLAAVGLMAAALVPQPTHAADFDGRWSVLVVTNRGPCDRSYHYLVRIVAGRLHYESRTAVEIEGRVEPNGEVSLDLRLGNRTAIVSGRLTERTGVGIWRGVGSGAICAGYWQAERR
jgi:hypothetical protein